MKYAHGVVQWLAADAATTTYTVSGIPFTPKALRFYWVGLQSASDAVSETVNERRGAGFAISPSNRRSVGSFSQDTAAAANCGAAARNDCVACTTDGAGASDGRLDLNAINSDGFQLIVDDATPANLTVAWEAWGGDDITATLVDIAEPAATGDVDYAVPGFELSDLNDQVVMIIGSQTSTALNTDAAQDSGMCVGFATGGADAENVTVCGNSDDGDLAMDTDGYCKTGECLSMIVRAGGNATCRAKLTQFNPGGFRLNWIARATTNRRYFALAIKGGQWRAGAYTINGNTLSATATVSGLPFKPIGLSLIGRMSVEQAAGTSTTQDRLGFGNGSSTAQRMSMGVLDENAPASGNCEVNTTLQYDQVLCYPSTAGALLSAYDVNQMNSDGFQIIVDTAGGVASEWQGYLTFGDMILVDGVTPPYPGASDDILPAPQGNRTGISPAIGNRPLPPVGRPGPGLAGIARFNRLKFLQADREVASAGQTVTPDSVVATFTVTTPTVVAGAVTVAPDPVAASFTAVTPTVVAGVVTLTPDPVAASFTTTTPTLVAGVATLTPDPVAAAFTTTTPTVVAGTVTLTPDPVVAAFTVTDPSVTSGVAVAPDSVVATFTATTPTLVAGGVSVAPDSVVAAFTTTTPTVVAGVVTLTPAPVVAAFVVVDPVVTNQAPPEVGGVQEPIGRFRNTPPIARPGPGRPGIARLSEWQRFKLGSFLPIPPQIISPDSVVAAFTVTTPTVVAGVATLTPSPVAAAFTTTTPTIIQGNGVSPDPVVANFVTTTPTLVAGGVSLTPDSVVATFTVPTPNVSAVFTATPSPVVAAFTVTTPAVTSVYTATPSPAVAVFTVIAPALVAGAVVLAPDPAVAVFSVPTPTAFTAGVILDSRMQSTGTSEARLGSGLSERRDATGGSQSRTSN